MSEDIKSLDGLKSAVSGEEVSMDAVAAPREPKRDDLGRSYATGKRKDAVARVWIKKGSGKITVNKKPVEKYFARPTLQMIIQQAFSVTNAEDQFCLLYTSPSPRDYAASRMPSSA